MDDEECVSSRIWNTCPNFPPDNMVIPICQWYLFQVEWCAMMDCWFILYGLVFGPNWSYICYLHIQPIDLLIFEFFGRPLDPIKRVVEAVVSNSWSDYQRIPNWQWNIKHLRVYGEAVKETEIYKV